MSTFYAINVSDKTGLWGELRINACTPEEAIEKAKAWMRSAVSDGETEFDCATGDYRRLGHRYQPDPDGNCRVCSYPLNDEVHKL